MAGGVLGGIIGGMLFRSLGFGGMNGTGGGIGLFDIILIGALLYGIYWFIKRKRQAAAPGGVYYRETGSGAEPVGPSYGAAGAGAGIRDEDYREKGIGHIRQMDSGFSDIKFKEDRTDDFFRIQGAWADRDMSSVRQLLTEEMFDVFQGEAENLKAERKFNKLDNIAVRTVDIVEAWQEEGKDFITVKFLASLVDYVTDESGKVISGSKTDPVKFEEYWTFTRQVGNNPWKLSAVTQPQ
ncbi:MAG TPA: Tim44 domain-containing protein [Syntrophales bacterium]|nr:Tim44 domain-containing protein [Syntrophales bacterium]